MKGRKTTIDEILKRGIPSTSKDPREQTDALGERVFEQLMSQHGLAAADDYGRNAQRSSLWPRVATLAAAAGVVLAVLVTFNNQRDDTVLRVGGTARASDASKLVTLADGSRIEMKPNSELSLERADDGLRIRLTAGGIIVNAAQQRQGHLYVRTKDVTVSVIGTVFLVNAELEGSRVAVIEGEVHVQQDGIEKRLRPGEQLVSKAVMKWQPVSQEISWSSSRGSHLALLRQATAQAPGKASEPNDAFEVASVRPSTPSGGGYPGARGARGGGQTFQVEHNRFVAASATLHRLILFAYGFQGFGADPVYGGPAWMKSDRFEIQALMPEGSPSYNNAQLLSGNVPKLRAMMKALLADRFKLASHPEMKEMSVYNLVVVKEGKLKLSEDQTPRDPLSPPQGFRVGAPMPHGSIAMMFTPAGGRVLSGTAIPIATLAGILSEELGRVVVDRTHLQGLFDFRMEFAAVQRDLASVSEVDLSLPAPLPADPVGPYLFTALQELGLKLESSKVAVEVLVIDRAEKPTEN